MKQRDRQGDEHVMLPPKPLVARKGRGAVSNIQGRFEVHGREQFDDGWDGDGEDGGDGDGQAPRIQTQITDEFAKTILSRNASPDVPFNVSLNPYRGCEHGCVYCFARPSHSYLGLSPGLDFESRLFAKVNAADLLRRELARPGYAPEPIAIGVNTDAYQPCERERGLTRQVLEVLHECEHPIALITKSSLIERDIDLLAPMAAKQQAIAAITLTTLDPAISRTLEPRAAAPARRLRTIRMLAEAGIPVAVSVAPIIPFITEPDIERILLAAREAGAINATYVVLRLPWEINPLFQQWLQAHFPERAQRVMNRVREMHGGKDYDGNFSHRMKGDGVWAELIRQRFRKMVDRLGMNLRGNRFETLEASHFRRPLVVPQSAAKQCGNATGQLDLF